MSSTPAPSRMRPNQNQFLGDLTQVFRRHKIPFGQPADLDHLAGDLKSNESFRSDLFSLCTAISHMSEKDLSPEALLDLVARALTNAPRKSPPIEMPEQARDIFVSQYEAWSNRGAEFDSIGQKTVEELGWQLPTNPFSTAATLSGRSSKLDKPSDGGVSAPSRSLAPETPIGSLTLGELKSYLEDIEQRVSRLQPFLDAVAKSASAEPSAAAAPASVKKPANGSIRTPSKTPEGSLARATDQHVTEAANAALVSASAGPSRDREPSAIPVQANTVEAAEETFHSHEAVAKRNVQNSLVAAAPSVLVRPGRSAGLPVKRFAQPADELDAGFPLKADGPALPTPVDAGPPPGTARAAPAAVVPATTLSPLVAHPASFPESSNAIAVRGRTPFQSRTAIPAAAAAVLLVSVGILGYKHLSPAASAASTVGANVESPSAKADPVPQPAPAATRITSVEHTRVAEAPSRPAPPPTPKPILPNRPVSAPIVSNSSPVIESALKPLLKAAATLPPEAPLAPTSGQPPPIIPDSNRTTTVVPTPHPATAESHQVIEPYNQRAVATPSPSPESQVTNIAANTHSPVPTATPAPITRKPPDNLVVSVPSPTMMTYAISAPSPEYPNFRRPVDSAVIVQASIGKDGRVISVHSITGAADLAGAAVAAVQKWRFRPYLVEGSPVQVVTNIKFVFKAPI